MRGGRIKNRIIFVMFALLSLNANAHQTHCDLDFGYHFYCNDGAEEEIAVQPKKQKDHKAELEQMKQEL